MTENVYVRILVVDDDEEDFFLFKELLSEVKDQRFTIEWAPSYEVGRKAILDQNHDVYFLDYRLEHTTGLELLKEMILEDCKLPMILLTGFGDHEVDLEAMRIGAADYIIKDQLAPYVLERSIRYSIHRAKSIEALREREAQVMMQDRMASVGLLASSLAHEIGTPLGVIRGRAEYLSMQLQGDEAVKKNVDIIISQIDRVSRLIHSLLNLARGDQVMHSTRVNLIDSVGEVLELMNHELERHNIDIINEVKSHMSVAVLAQSESLHQVVLNLIVNSIHAIESAIDAGRASNHFIRLWVEDEGSAWCLNVQDSGTGISEKNLRNLFDPFFTTKDIGRGTGLGLSTCYRIIESWGGSIGVESTEGSGSTFKVFLPKSS